MMWNKFKQWNNENDVQIRWFLIGTFVAFGWADVSRGDWTWAGIDFLLAYINYALVAK